MATLTFKIKNGEPPYVVKLKQVSITGNGNYGYSIYDGTTSFAEQKILANGTDVQFTAVPSGSFILEIVDDNRYSTIDFINVP